MKKYLVSALLFGLLAAEAAFAASPAEFGAAINIAGRQRMLTQKMAKESLFIHLEVEAEKNQEAMKKTIELFDSSLAALIAGDSGKSLPKPPDDKISAQLKKVQEQWAEYRKTVETKDLKKISKNSTVILREMNKAVKLYEKASTKAGIKGSGKVINIAGRQRMLTQKMAKESLLIAADIDKKKNLSALKSTHKLFDTSLAALLNGNKKMRIEAPGSEEIKTQLQLVEKLWKDYGKTIQGVIDSKKASDADIKKIFDLNPEILAEMNKAVGMYEANANSQSH